ncbi:MAG: YggS family pyridoxal phosphate-dependent enzyme [Phocaeicola sp.]|uniref:YggS family pyridoxal phosphate-dependent enzyme n=1 Tax=Phocaeicola TaxID=909656 RepID=UPI00234F352A|nr:YggS family pyridoxal phosphate-dependent enzyme [Phocaeicola oris]MCE2615452.1 YggS family pyridoxal phosphate-dependent enzyme [Phocaeicola oris]
MSIESTIKEIRKELPLSTRLVAVSKFHPNEMIMEAYNAGQRVFGENHVQEMTQKYDTLPKDIEWHFIGHLQTNKVKYIAPFVSIIHGIDTFKLLSEVNKQAAKYHRVIPCLLQIHIAEEDTKFGFSFDECRQMLDMGEWKALDHVHLCGVMGMATNTPDVIKVRKEFHNLKTFFDEIKGKYFKNDTLFKEVSMGMTHDYHIAVEEGSTLVRIGTKIFGERNYINYNQ